MEALKAEGVISGKEEEIDIGPELLPHAIEFWIAFQTLSEKRLWSETGPNPIPLSEILAYVEYIGISSNDKREELLYIVSAMDRNFIEFAIDRIQKERKKQVTKRRPK